MWAQVWSKGSCVGKVMLLHAKGDSMIGVGINDGDLIVATITNCADVGKTWTKQIVLENQEGEFSYPSIIAVVDVFYVTYTYNREQIRFARIEI